MPARTLLATGIAVLVLLALVPACEDTEVTAPANSSIILQAVPASILIDQDAGETVGSAQIYALVLDTGGLSLEDIPVVFTSTGGRLDSENFCDNDACTRTGEDCLVDDDCPVVTAPAIKTNQDGVAVDRLTLRLIEDPDTVDVTAQISVGSQKVTVLKNVNLGPVDPVALITAVPADGQRTGLPFAVDGSASTFDPQVELTCFEWSIDSSINANDQVIRGADKSIITLTLGSEGDTSQEQDLTVTLRVSDVPGLVCSDVVPPAPSDFSNKSAVISYQIRCDLTDPIVDAGSNQSASLAANGGNVSITLTATASDPESSTLSYLWDCGNGLGGPEQSVTCDYNTEGTFTAKVIVQNECGRVSQDGLNVTINP